jgi:hypothetical protein
LQHRVRQVPIDINRRTRPDRALAILRGVIATQPDARRIGIITFRSLRQYIKSLELPIRNRIAKVAHFGGTNSRGSNEWIEKCDLLIVLGTPRPPQSQVAAELVRLRLGHALTHDPSWMAPGRGNREYGDFWCGATESGNMRVVRTFAYGDHRWREASDFIVGAELEQCIGRARSVLANGIECLVVSTYPIESAVLVDSDPILLSAHDMELLLAAAGLGDVWKITWPQVLVHAPRGELDS